MLLARAAPTGRRAALDGWLGGAGFMVAVHHWLIPSLHLFIVLIALLLGALWAPWGWLVRRLLGGTPGRRSVVAATVLVPCAWLLVELVRSWEYLGGPWGLLGASQWQVAPAAAAGLDRGRVAGQLPGGGGEHGAGRAPRRALVPGGRGLGAGGRGGGHDDGVGLGTGPDPGWGVRAGGGGAAGGDRRADAALRPWGAADPCPRGQGRGPGGVGESSVGFDLSARPDLAYLLAALSRDVGADILVNVDARRTDGLGISKTSVLMARTGRTYLSYDKMRLVPFGEYVPARTVLGWATSVGRAAGEDRIRGEHQVVMDAGPVRLGPLVCFESAFPDMSRHLADDGAQLLVAQSSTSSFQGSWAPAQHASLAALRSAESWRPMVHATLTGISAVHDARGERLGPVLGTSRSAAQVYDVPLDSGRSPYDRLGDWVPRLAVLLLAGAGAYEAALRRSARSRR